MENSTLDHSAVMAKNSPPIGKDRTNTSSQSVWNVVKVLSLIAPFMLFLPFVYSTIGGNKAFILSGFHILIGTHGLGKELGAQLLNPTSVMVWAVMFMILGLALTLIKSRSATIFVIFTSIASLILVYLSSSMFT